jgi:ATP-dependent RNA helicase RhlE
VSAWWQENISIMNQDKTVRFADFQLHPALARGVQELGFETPRPIQTRAIPAIMDGRDALGLAQTGTGKTAAFSLPILHHILTDRRNATRAMIVAPTRELATQIATEIRALSRFAKIKVAVVYGGVPVHKQRGVLKARPEIVVGCPGRILDLMQQNILRTDDIETLVLDEADQMFDMGFLPGIRQIIRALPKQRQNLLFSATMPTEVRHLTDELLHAPLVVELASRAPAETIDHSIIPVADRRKRELLDEILGWKDCQSAIIFTRTKHRAKRLADQLSKAGHKAVGLQGNMSQPQRDRAMKGFRSGRYRFLVATDIVARGIDVSDVSYVVNFDAPTTAEAYTHRIGRTGRAEREGIAVTFVTQDNHDWLRATERMLGSKIERMHIAGFESDVNLHAPKPRAAAPRNQSRYGGRRRRRSAG